MLTLQCCCDVCFVFFYLGVHKVKMFFKKIELLAVHFAEFIFVRA